MPTRTWLPSDWMDEITPDWAESPDAFVQRDDHGRFWFGPIDSIDDEWHSPQLVLPGWVTRFCWMDDYGAAELTVTSTGWSIAPEFPSDVSSFSIDHDRMAESIDALVQGDGPGERLESGTYLVSGINWQDAGPFMLVRAEDSTHQFVPVQ